MTDSLYGETKNTGSETQTTPSLTAEEQEKPPYVIEGARSSRARCKTCRKKIAKGGLRLGVLVVGPFGPGYMWHHLNCAAGRLYEKLEEAYRLEAWREAAEPPDVPSLESLRHLQEKAAERRANRKYPPYAERAPSGRSNCKHCGQPIEKGAWRVVLGREVQFGSQVRTAQINVLPEHVVAVLNEADCTSNANDLASTLAENSDISPNELQEVLRAMGPLS